MKALQTDLSDTYWNTTGKYEQIGFALGMLLPPVGKCPDAQRSNKHLDRLRRARNCYYDLYNNGLINKHAEFYRLFGFGVRQDMKENRGVLRRSLVVRIERAMDEFILLAALEQGMLTPQMYNEMTCRLQM